MGYELHPQNLEPSFLFVLMLPTTTKAGAREAGVTFKWYARLFCDVTNVVEALSELEEKKIPYEFCRMGESWDDIEFTASGESDELALHIEPSVTIDVF